MTSLLRRLRPRDRRAIVLGLLVLAPVVTFVLVVRPYIGVLGEARERLVADRTLLARERALLQAVGGFGERQARLDTALEQRSVRLFTGDPTLASGQMARYLAAQAEASRVSIEASETAGYTEVVPGLEAVRMRFRAVSDVAGVLELVRRLEDGDRLVRVESLTLERRDRGDRGTRTRTTDAGAAVQVVSLAATIAGYALADRDGGAE